MTVYHSVTDGKTWCGLDARGSEEGGEEVLLLIAPERDQVTCPDCKATMPGARPLPTKVAEAVHTRMEAKAEEFNKRPGTEPADPEPEIDRKAIAEKARRNLDR